jgi:hypothetical protein
MLMLYVGLTLAILFFASAIGVYVYVRQKWAILAARQRETESRRRAVLDDFGDYAVWQMGQRAMATIPGGAPAGFVRTRRGFLRRMAVSLLVLIAGRRAVPAVAAASSGKALALEKGHPERKAWSDELRKTIRAQITTLETASDIEDFAPGYAKLSAQDRVDVWASLFVAIARFETTGYDPKAIYHESSGIDSVGLLQVSYENEGYYGLERLNRKARALEDPLVNLRCGVKILAVLVDRDGVIASGTGSSSRGGARSWSTLRPERKLSDIQQIVRNSTSPRRHIDTPHADSM